MFEKNAKYRNRFTLKKNLYRDKKKVYIKLYLEIRKFVLNQF